MAGIHQGVEKRSDLHAGFKAAAMAAGLRLDQVDAEITPAVIQRFEDIRRDKMCVNIDNGHRKFPFVRCRWRAALRADGSV